MIGPQPTGAVQGVSISATATEGLRITTTDGRPARLAIVTEDGQILAAGPAVAREAEAVAINAYRNLLSGKGHLRVISRAIEPGAAT